jgi:carboxyl-terminal processing protease
MKALMDSTYRTWKESTPVHISLFEYLSHMYKGPQTKEVPDFERGYVSAFSDIFQDSQLTWGGESIPPEHPVLHGRIIFLVDGGCASACEELLEAFKDNHRGTLVGETTEGTAGPSYIHDFHNGMTIRDSGEAPILSRLLGIRRHRDQTRR